MQAFDYVAVDARGAETRGRSWASSEQRLDQDLESRGLLLLRSRRLRSGSPRSARLTRHELVMLTTQLAVSLSAGVPLAEGLAGIGRRLRRERARALMESLVSSLEAGEDLSSVLDRYPEAFPVVFRASVRAGEASGALDVILNRMARYLEWAASMRATTIQALIYPAILFAAIVGLITILLTFVLPRILGMFPAGEASLPAQTKVVLFMSNFLREHGLILGIGFAALVIGTFAASKRPGGRLALHRCVLRLPLVGEVARKIATSKFASTASILQSAGCDVFTVLSVSGSACGNAEVARTFTRTADAVRRGGTITAGLEHEDLTDPLLIQMVSVGEKTGELDQCLDRLVEYYDEEIPRAVKRMLSMLEPTILMIAGAVVAFILLAALLPIFQLYETIG